MRQGKSKRTALDHAAQRYGVTYGAILREIQSWHEYRLPDAPEEGDLTIFVWSDDGPYVPVDPSLLEDEFNVLGFITQEVMRNRNGAA
jgi:hypothetical protein